MTRTVQQVISSLPLDERAKVIARGRELKRIAELEQVCAELYQGKRQPGRPMPIALTTRTSSVRSTMRQSPGFQPGQLLAGVIRPAQVITSSDHHRPSYE